MTFVGVVLIGRTLNAEHIVLIYVYMIWISTHRGSTLWQALLTFVGAIMLVYVSLTIYEKPYEPG